MATPYSDIDNMFLADIKDDTFLDFTEAERLSILNDLRIKAITRFKACQKDLTDRTEAIEANENELAIEGQFNETLTEEEKLILATIMRKYWLNDKIYNLELLQQRMTTKDFRMTSQAEHLLRLTVLNQELDKEISRMIVDYTLYTYGDS
jgi:hypothetical protein